MDGVAYASSEPCFLKWSAQASDARYFPASSSVFHVSTIFSRIAPLPPFQPARLSFHAIARLFGFQRLSLRQEAPYARHPNQDSPPIFADVVLRPVEAPLAFDIWLFKCPLSPSSRDTDTSRRCLHTLRLARTIICPSRRRCRLAFSYEEEQRFSKGLPLPAERDI